ncbi:Pentatricopeptide repeat-containing protein, chloroplastic [Symbiodinium microadriaticum]|uniref:Pentatricopeptide repeat-containing protein, chloroplastic n=1 Tax=Symbiodinium microadriaticum TaxID=2951 RepID=A0A1Q9EPR0_SYMMI|nr:Pentatricopeptide repeat-containing protein, chloroplastic [Symbiodinium microadriaticum]
MKAPSASASRGADSTRQDQEYKQRFGGNAEYSELGRLLMKRAIQEKAESEISHHELCEHPSPFCLAYKQDQNFCASQGQKAAREVSALQGFRFRVCSGAGSVSVLRMSGSPLRGWLPTSPTDEELRGMQLRADAFHYFAVMKVRYGLAMDAWAEGGHWLQSLAIFDSIGSHTVPDRHWADCALRVSRYPGRRDPDRGEAESEGVCQKAADWEAACDLLSAMASAGFKPDTVSLGAAPPGIEWEGCPPVLALALGGRRCVEPQRNRCSELSPKAMEPDLICFNVAISACEMAGRWQTALVLLDDLGKNCSPTATSFNAAITACGKGGEWQRALILLSSMHDAAVLPDRISLNAAISACDNGGMWPVAVHLLFSMHGQMQAPDHISFNAAISACEQGGAWHQALAVYQKLILADLTPDELTHNAAVSSVAVSSAWVAAIHFLTEEMLSKGLCPNGLHAGAVARSVTASEGVEEGFKEIWLAAAGEEVAEVPLKRCLKSNELAEDAAQEVSLLASAPGKVAELLQPMPAALHVVSRLDRFWSHVSLITRKEVFALRGSGDIRGDAPGAGRLTLVLAVHGVGESSRKEYICLCEGPAFGPVGHRAVLTYPLRVLQLSFEMKGIDEVRGWDLDFSHTAMKHQIRAHLAHAGRPIVGDWTYGRREESSVPLCPRLFLHCRRIELRTVAGKDLAVEAPLPRELEEVLEEIRQVSSE